VPSLWPTLRHLHQHLRRERESHQEDQRCTADYGMSLSFSFLLAFFLSLSFVLTRVLAHLFLLSFSLRIALSSLLEGYVLLRSDIRCPPCVKKRERNAPSPPQSLHREMRDPFLPLPLLCFLLTLPFTCVRPSKFEHMFVLAPTQETYHNTARKNRILTCARHKLTKQESDGFWGKGGEKRVHARILLRERSTHS